MGTKFAGPILGARLARCYTAPHAAKGAGIQLKRLKAFEQGTATPAWDEWIDLWRYLSTDPPRTADNPTGAAS
jgi:hypothetical protein